MAGLHVGSLVEHPRVPGIGRVGAIDGTKVRIDCFESVATSVVDSRWVAYAECRPAKLLLETRVYWQDSDTGNWRAGRIVGAALHLQGETLVCGALSTLSSAPAKLSSLEEFPSCPASRFASAS